MMGDKEKCNIFSKVEFQVMAFLGRAQDGQEIYQGHQKEHEIRGF